jgi:hypothetical protein
MGLLTGHCRLLKWGLVNRATCAWTRMQPPAHAGPLPTDFSTLKMEAIRSSEMSVHTRYTWRHIPEDGIFHSHRHENLKSYKDETVSKVLCNCEALANLLLCNLGFYFMKPSDCVRAPLSKILHFIWSVGLLGAYLRWGILQKIEDSVWCDSSHNHLITLLRPWYICTLWVPVGSFPLKV